ncbi:MAG: pentapeptide repeat-containing protein, partial [Bacteroidetes bacterium]|nr:pentapeptide repeat-containing protein [Bacteroidota bacterium]
VHFKSCKLLGIRFDQCNPIGLQMYYTDCVLDHSSFYKIKMHRSRFVSCRLQGVDFSECDFNESSFTGCEFGDNTFDKSSFQKCDFRGTRGLIINPAANNLKGAVFNQDALAGLLAGFQIEIDETE